MTTEPDRTLRKHWADITSSKIDPHTSNTRYKYHLAKLMDVYSTNRRVDKMWTERPFLHKTPSPTRPKESEELMKKIRESQWDNHVTLTDFLNERKLKHEREEKSQNRKLKSSNNDSSTVLRQNSYTEVRPNSSSSKRNKLIKKIKHYCNNENASELELISNGQYRFTDEQKSVYNNFAKMLSDFDPHDMVKILEDVIQDAQESTLLHQYGGTIDDSDNM